MLAAAPQDNRDKMREVVVQGLLQCTNPQSKYCCSQFVQDGLTEAGVQGVTEETVRDDGESKGRRAN